MKKNKSKHDEKSSFELFITERILETIVEFLNKTMKKAVNKNHLIIDSVD